MATLANRAAQLPAGIEPATLSDVEPETCGSHHGLSWLGDWAPDVARQIAAFVDSDDWHETAHVLMVAAVLFTMALA